mgnify:FL=1
MLHLTMFGWLLFRMDSVDQLVWATQSILRTPVWNEEMKDSFLLLGVLCFPVLLMQLEQLRTDSMEVLARANPLLKFVFAVFVFAALMTYRVQTRIEFIYFQF